MHKCTSNYVSASALGQDNKTLGDLAGRIDFATVKVFTSLNSVKKENCESSKSMLPQDNEEICEIAVV